MRKTITILLLMGVLCSSMSSCKKQSTLSQNKILFTAKKKGYTNIVRLDTKIKSKKIVNSLPFQPEDIVISHDQKKMAIVTITETVGGNKSDIYTMNIDGTNLKKVIDVFILPKTYIVDQMCFTPDNQQIVVLTTCYQQDTKDELIYLVNLDGTKLETFPEKDPNFTLMHQIFFEILHTKITANNALRRNYAEHNGTIKYNPEKLEFLLHDFKNKSIGIYSWKERKFLPILNYTDLIDDFSWTPDRKSVLFTVKVDEKKIDEHLYEFYDVFLYHISGKSIVKIMTSTKIRFSLIFWLSDGKSFLYLIKGAHSYKFMFDSEIKKFDLSTMNSAFLCKSGHITRIVKFTDSYVAVFTMGSDGVFNQIIDINCKKSESFNELYIHFPEDFYQLFNVISRKNMHIFFWQNGFLIYDSNSNKTISHYLFPKTEDNEHSNITDETISSDQSSFYFVNQNSLYLFDNSGKLLHQDVLTPSNNINDTSNSDSSFLLGFFSSPTEITYLEYVEN